MLQPLHCQVGKDGPGQGHHTLAEDRPGQDLGGILVRLDQVPQLQLGPVSHVQQAVLQQRHTQSSLHRQQQPNDFQ